MNPEDRDLLLRDLCARIPYGVKFKVTDTSTTELSSIGIKWSGSIPVNLFYKRPQFYLINEFGNQEYKPYLRSLSSMSKEEVKEFYEVEDMDHPVGYIKPQPNWHFTIKGIDWLNAHHFDYRGLIEKGLAIEVTKDDNPYE